MSLIVRQLNLVCDSIIIDKIICKRRIWPRLMLEDAMATEETSTLEDSTIANDPSVIAAQDTFSADGKIKQKYIVMDRPCSKDLPEKCKIMPLIPVEESNEDMPDSKDVEDTDESEGAEDDVAEEDDEVDEDGFESENHGHKKPHKKHPRYRHGRPNTHGNHGQHGHGPQHQKHKHPWKDRCVAVGWFYGHELYGCKFKATTKYWCEAIGELPVPEITVTPGGNPNNTLTPGGDEKCTCPGPGTGPVCGYELPAVCKANPHNVYVCRGGKGSKAEVLAICRPGTQCQPRPLPVGAICGASNCDCHGSDELCSDTFPDECRLEKNAIHKCTEGGKPEPVRNCENGQVCVTISDGAICTNNDCKCPTDGTVCGEVFPITCKIKATALYTCINGQDPVFEKDCYPDRCSASKASFAATAVFEATAMDQCTDKCTCSGSGTVCGSTFPPECKLPASSLYKCDGNGKAPVPGRSCTEGGCSVNAGDDSCSTDPCTCPGLGFAPVCGSELPAECRADPNTIYHCPGGSGTRPGVLEICNPGTICTKKPLPVGAICGSGTCDCTGDNEVCSDSFPGECQNIVPNSVYKCTSSGTPELVKTCNSTQACVSVADGSICTNTDCKCPDDGTICGEVFPLYCKLKTTALYTCTKGADPAVFKDCYPERCQASVASLSAAAAFEATAMDQCTDSCKCIEEGKVCGSTFPPKCDPLASSLYTCSGNGATPVEAEKCGAGGCTVNAGDDSCSTNDCTCPGDGTAPVCSSLLPAGCNAKPNTIYHCPGGAGTTPEVLAICDPGTLCQPKPSPVGAICGSSTCDCTGSGEVCSNIFPGRCNVVPNSIYKCTENGKPEFFKTCDTTEACVSVADGSICIVPDCRCPDDGTICGEVFPLSCKLKTAALYTCVKGQDPVLSKDCDPQSCSASLASFSALSAVFEAELANDKCTDPCLCQGTSKACGSTFLPECNKDPSTIYICNGEGTVPVDDLKCRDGQCVVNAGDDSCGVTPGLTPSDCTCPNDAPVCGWALLEVCRGEVEIDPNAIYTCPGGTGTTPEVAKICLPGTTCQAKPYPVGAACGGTTCECSGSGEVCSDVFPGDCSVTSNSIYRCTEAGVPKLVKTCEAGQTCLTVSDGSLCVSGDCKCTRDGEVCGESFPQNCGLKATAIYTCVTSQAPVFKSDCYPARCSATKAAIEGVFATADTCIDSCLCASVDPAICGSTFPLTCGGLEAAAIYKCDAAGQPPSLVEVCTTGICVVNAGDDKCDEGNACKCIDSDDVCGSQFPGQCDLSLGGLYSCAGASSDPVLVDVCPLGVCIVQLGSDKCGPNPCDCKDGTAACGSSFPPECLRNSTTIYNCPGGEGTAPVPGEKCQSGVCNVVNTGDDVCLPAPSPSIARPTSAGPTSAGPTTAGPTSEGPISAAPTPAVPESTTAAAIIEPTTTSEPATPTPTPSCVCSGSTKVCGSALPANCGFNVTSLYTCGGAGLAPETPVECPAGCNTTTTPDHTCNPDCLAQVTAVNTAIDAITAAINPIVNSTPVTTAAFGPVLTLFNDIKTNLTSVAPIPTALAPIAGAANETLAGVIKLFQQVQAIIPSPANTTLQPALDALNNLLPLLQALINCAGGTKDCSGLRTLFTEISNVITLLQGAPAASQYATLLQNVTAVVLDTTASTDLTALNRAGADINTIIDALTVNATFAPELGQAVKVVYETAKILLVCEGVNITIFSDKCAAFRAKVEGYLSDFINFVRGILGSIPILGPLISDPILEALNDLVVDLQTGSATAIGGVLSIFQAIISIFGILPADDTTNSIRDYLLNLVGIMNVPPECQEPANCSGLIKIVTIIGQGAVTLISSVFPGIVGEGIKALLSPAMQGLIDALGGASTGAIQVAYDVLNTAVKAAEMAFPEAITRPFRIFLDGCKAILDCLNNGTTNTMVTRSGVSISANPIPTGVPLL
ncbi:hypothetical protein BGZ75_007138 [Mortierella antarctica]|nr:hypothetical protein BGZ75_007138 [Mortierella antarctica]